MSKFPWYSAIYSQLRKDRINVGYALANRRQKLSEQETEQEVMESNLLDTIFRRGKLKDGKADISYSRDQIDTN